MQSGTDPDPEPPILIEPDVLEESGSEVIHELKLSHNQIMQRSPSQSQSQSQQLLMSPNQKQR